MQRWKELDRFKQPNHPTPRVSENPEGGSKEGVVGEVVDKDGGAGVGLPRPSYITMAASAPVLSDEAVFASMEALASS